MRGYTPYRYNEAYHWTHNKGGILKINGARTRKLTTIRKAAYAPNGPANEIWALQDGYGEPGFWPPQGWDWSGIRDSSEKAIDAMYEVAGRFLGYTR